jgi:hypothetical protein
MYRRNPELVKDDHFQFSVEKDGSETDGLILQLKSHLRVWDEPCLIRLSDVLKRCKQFSTKKTLAESIKYQEYAADCCHAVISYLHLYNEMLIINEVRKIPQGRLELRTRHRHILRNI